MLTSKVEVADEERLVISQAQSGSQAAAGKLVNMHQRFIYNVALKLVHDKDDAKDLTQEVLIKMLTKLSQFSFKSNFRTWLYRITMNHFLKSKMRKSEIAIHSFDELAPVLDELYDHESMTEDEHRRYNKEIIAFRNKCTSSMLLCLDRPQRIIFVLGAIFNLKSPVAAKILNISPTNFRMQLSRAKADLFQFMNNKCGLINPDNPCRCHKKVKGFIRDGIIDPQTNQFLPEAIETIGVIAPEKNKELDVLMAGKYLPFFTGQPYEHMDNGDKLVSSLLADPDVRSLFLLS
ncbi:RNA polymerase sigma factor [Mucilaginibacter aquaedulcis]|uniref:RNA polymerase sigma factor n=1 Tax=Mucilaginibacter aquaedulcis TaxID=1187081 RepID=UPI0025B337DD|nr:RNA polymerase sigma factor [Mucilaginibacter aquaedulcis]MDN3549202.1 RNA polymerase sigma factor [Mucilaginibacter aquaedulcis]